MLEVQFSVDLHFIAASIFLSTHGTLGEMMRWARRDLEFHTCEVNVCVAARREG